MRVATHNAPPLSSPVGALAPRAPPSRRNVAVLSYAEYVPTLTAAAAFRVKAALSKAAWWPWPLTFWPWKWCPSHVWRGLSCVNFSLPRPVCSRLRPDERDRQTSDRQTDVRQKHRLIPRQLGDIIRARRMSKCTKVPVTELLNT